MLGVSEALVQNKLVSALLLMNFFIATIWRLPHSLTFMGTLRAGQFDRLDKIFEVVLANSIVFRISPGDCNVH